MEDTFPYQYFFIQYKRYVKTNAFFLSMNDSRTFLVGGQRLLKHANSGNNLQ